MNLLIITQKVNKNDPILGFFHSWIYEFAKHFGKVTVVCLECGMYDLPANVKILSLGKEKGVSRMVYLWRFFKYIWSERKNYDAVFVHMNQIYVILGSVLWKLTGKKIGLWYVHKKVTFSLRVATWLADEIFTSAKESFGLLSRKVHYLGHGINTELFFRPTDYVNKERKILEIIHVGRITPIKHCEVLIEAMALLRDDSKIESRAVFIGAPMNESDRKYYEWLKILIDDKGLKNQINFVGNISNGDINKYYWDSDISVNMCPTGGMDKVVLESMAAGVTVFVSNKIFRDVFDELKDNLIFEFKNPQSLAEKIADYLKADIKANTIKKIVEKSKDFDTKRLIERITKVYTGTNSNY